MKLLSLLCTIAPAVLTMLLADHMGVFVLLPALLIEAVCVFALRRTGRSVNLTALCFAMEGAVLLAAGVSVCGRIGTPYELGMAVLIAVVVVHIVAYLTLCGFVLKK